MLMRMRMPPMPKQTTLMQHYFPDPGHVHDWQLRMMTMTPMMMMMILTMQMALVL